MTMTMTARNGNAAIPMKVLSTLIGRKRRKVSLEPRPNSVGRFRCSCGKAVDAGNSWRGGSGRAHGGPAVGDFVIGLQEPSGVIRPLSGWLIWTPGGRLLLRGSVARPHCRAAGSRRRGACGGTRRFAGTGDRTPPTVQRASVPLVEACGAVCCLGPRRGSIRSRMDAKPRCIVDQRFVDRVLGEQLHLCAVSTLVGFQPGENSHPGAALDAFQMDDAARAAVENCHAQSKGVGWSLRLSHLKGEMHTIRRFLRRRVVFVTAWSYFARKVSACAECVVV
jgi:hypothetical protein